MPTNTVNLLDVNPLERITGDVAISQFNYESIMNALVQWDNSRNDSITVRLATRTEPYFVDYVIHTKYYYDKNYGVINSAVLLQPNGFAYKNRLQMVVSEDESVTLRINTVNNGNTTWRLYEDVIVTDEFDTIDEGQSSDHISYIKQAENLKHSYDKAGLYFRFYDQPKKLFVLYKTLRPLILKTSEDGKVFYDQKKILKVRVGGEEVEFAERIGIETSRNQPYTWPMTFYYSFTTAEPQKGTVYFKRAISNINANSTFDQLSSGFEPFCKHYDSDAMYSAGDVVYCNGEFYISLVDNPKNPPIIIDTYQGGSDICETNQELWARALLLPMPNAVITGSGVIRTVSDTDVQGYVLRNIGSTESSDTTSISIMGTISVAGTTTEQAKGVNILQTSNYANWPEYGADKWSEGASYVTNASLSAFNKQDYSAVMVFKHFGDDEHFCYKNIINYDGPDVDQGLCILLPVTIMDEHNVTHDPADGSMLEFLFNIWPNHKYDGRAVNDLIINKSQIYVYSVPDYGEYKMQGFNADTVEPIAKFSMARLTNFYMFSENVGVPDRPVCYKARFIYSKVEKRWKTYDYYQFPDHIFLSPHGFVDPSDPKAYSVQTAGFPLYQNPFSDFDLTAIHVDNTYRNQLQNPDITTEE